MRHTSARLTNEDLFALQSARSYRTTHFDLISVHLRRIEVSGMRLQKSSHKALARSIPVSNFDGLQHAWLSELRGVLVLAETIGDPKAEPWDVHAYGIARSMSYMSSKRTDAYQREDEQQSRK